MLLHLIQSSKLHLALVDVQTLLVETQVVLPQQVQVEVCSQISVMLIDLLIGGEDNSHRGNNQQAHQYQLYCIMYAIPIDNFPLLSRLLRHSRFHTERTVDRNDHMEIIIKMFTIFLKRSFTTEKWHHTTILALKRAGQTVIIGDGQVSLGSTKVKIDARKIRKMNDGVYCGFAGSLADAFYLIEGLEQVMSKYPKQTLKSCISYAKEWRTGKQLRHLEATLIVIDKDLIVELDGTGNVLEIEDVIGIGSGGLYAECAARALIGHTQLTGEQIAQEAMKIAASKCIYTSDRFVMEKII